MYDDRAWLVPHHGQVIVQLHEINHGCTGPMYLGVSHHDNKRAVQTTIHIT